jgi:hypothetical protein
MANPLEGFKKLPTWGKVTVIGGGVVVAYFAYRAHENNAAAAASSATTTSTGTDPVTGLPYADDDETDPMTGMTYLAEAQEYGSVQAAEEALGGYSSADAGTLGTGGFYTSAYNGDGVDTGAVGTTSGYGTNAAWAQAAESGLTEVGYSSTDVAAALGAYLSSQPLTTDQATIVYAAIAEYGPPPVGSFSVIMAPTTSASTTGNSSGASSTTSTGAGTGTSGSATTSTSSTSTSTAPAAAATISGGKTLSVGNNTAVISWTGHNASSYVVKITGPGAINGQTSKVGVAQATYSGLEAGHTYDVAVTPYNSAGVAGTPGTITFKTLT